MTNDSRDEAGKNAEILTQFRNALDQSAPRGGLERVRLATRTELQRLRRPLCGFAPRWALAAVAALIMLAGAGFLLIRPPFQQTGRAVICPHGEPERELNWRRRPASAESEFLREPDHFQRICHCYPLYSGNLRHP